MDSCFINGAATLGCFFPLIGSIIFWLIACAGIVALFMIVFAGYQFMFSGGDAKSLDGARKTLSYAILGLILVFLAFFILSLIGYITGVACLGDIAKGQLSFTTCAR